MKIRKLNKDRCEGCGEPLDECECEPCVWLGTRENCDGCEYEEDCSSIFNERTQGRRRQPKGLIVRQI